MSSFLKSRYFVLSLIFFLFLCLFIFSGFLFYAKAIIYEISPIPASHEDLVVIKGSNLGSNLGEININNTYLTKSSIVSWNHDEVIFKITEEINSGLIFVKCENGISNELFLVISRQVPIELKNSNKPFILTKDRVIIDVSSSTVIKGVNLLSSSGFVDIFLETNDNLYKILTKNILNVSEHEINFIPPKTLNFRGMLYVLVDNVQSNKVPFLLKDNFFKWTLSNSKEFRIIEKIYFNQDPIKDSISKSVKDDIDFNVFYLRPIESERQKIMEFNCEDSDFNISNLFFKSLRSNKFIFGVSVKTYKLNLEIFDIKLLENIKIGSDIGSQEFKVYVQNKRQDYASYESIDLTSLESLILSKFHMESTYRIARAIVDSLILNFSIIENNLSLSEAIEKGEISTKNLIILTNLLFLKYEIPLRNIVGLYYDVESYKLSEHSWFEFFLSGVGFIYFDIIKAILSKDSSKYFLNMSENYIQYGCKEDYEKNPFFDDYLDLFLLKYKSLTDGAYPLRYNFTLEKNFDQR